jgi:2-oxoisovalerate dehydrogenase E2 component (dihydrolipoyl transacylase)
MSTFNLPDLGEGLQEAEIVTWHVGAGDHVVADQPLVSVETEKAVVEIPSPHAGHVARLRAAAGERVKVGAALLEFEDGPHAETGTVVGELEKPAPTTAVAPAAPASVGAAAPGAVRASPAVRVRARELGVDLARVRASGPAGTVTREDVEAAAARAEPLRGARRTMAVNMARAWREVAHATIHDEADVEGWAVLEDVTARLIRALIAGCAAVPALNASFDAAATRLHNNIDIDLGLAIDSPDGLFVPVLRAVQQGDAADWRRRIDAAKKGVAQRRLAPDELRGATITLSNFGTIAGQHAALLIMPPQVAIIGAGRIIERALRVDGNVAVHHMLPLSLSFDHRAITGGEAARFLHAVIADLQRPAA